MELGAQPCDLPTISLPESRPRVVRVTVNSEHTFLMPPFFMTISFYLSSLSEQSSLSFNHDTKY